MLNPINQCIVAAARQPMLRDAMARGGSSSGVGSESSLGWRRRRWGGDGSDGGICGVVDLRAAYRRDVGGSVGNGVVARDGAESEPRNRWDC